MKKLVKSIEGLKVEVVLRRKKLNVKKININRIPAKDIYVFSLRLLDVLFTKEELHNSLLLPLKKSAS